MDRLLCDASVTPTSDVRTATMLVLHVTRVKAIGWYLIA
jgi:hypothetical protein